MSFLYFMADMLDCFRKVLKHRRYYGFLKGGLTEGQGVFERQRRKQSKGVDGEIVLLWGGVVGAYLVKYSNKCLEGKIIQMR